MPTDALPDFASVLQHAVDQGDLAGALTLVWQRGRVIHEAAVGMRDIAAAAPMTRDTLFRIASMTKPLTSLAALLLVEEGQLRLEDSIDRWIPELTEPKVLRDTEGAIHDVTPATRAITVEDLLTHRAGLGAFFTTTGP